MECTMDIGRDNRESKLSIAKKSVFHDGMIIPLRIRATQRE